MKAPIHHAKDALYNAKLKYDILFDKDLPVLRRNLFFAAMLGLASLIISPIDGSYKFNLGVIAGETKHIWAVYLGLLVTCLYQNYHFWIVVRHNVVSRNNFASMRDSFFGSLTCLVAADVWNSTTEIAGAKGVCLNKGFSTDTVAQNLSIKNITEAWGYIDCEKFDSTPALAERIGSDDRFRVRKENSQYQIAFFYEHDTEVYQYLIMHRDMYWLTKRKQIIEILVPLAIGWVAFLALLFKLATIAPVCKIG
ncbi:MAG: hypothetical protein MI808_23935 [Pseudomonadales bacterium]|nr:hypothetical protein [Pseudomonadales bacterium]